MKLPISSFFGVAPKIAPRYLPDGAAQVAINVEAFGQSLKPIRGTQAVAGGPSLGSAQTIYKYGQNNATENSYWFTWGMDVDVCRSQIAGDGSAEWTFWTGDGYPKAFHNGLGASNGGPSQALRLGLPAPDDVNGRLSLTVGQPEYCEVDGVRADGRTTEAICKAPGYCTIGGTIDRTKLTSADCTGAGGTWTPTSAGVWIVGAKESPAKITLTASLLEQVNSVYGIKISTNNGGDFVTVYPTSGGTAAVWITQGHLDQMTDSYGLKVSVDDGANWATAPLSDAVTVYADLLLSSTEIAVIGGIGTLEVKVVGGSNAGTINVPCKGASSPQALVAAINAYAVTLVTVFVSGSGVAVRSKSTGAGVTMTLTWASNASRTANGSSLTVAQDTFIAAIQAAKLNNVALATATRTGTDQITVTSATAGADVKLIVKWGASDSAQLKAVGKAADIDGLVALINAKNGPPLPANYTGATAVKVGATIVVSSVNVGADATLRIRWGEGTTQLLTATGVTADLGTKETRVYTYTWVLKENGMVWESAPWNVAVMPTADVYPDGSVTLTGFETVEELTAAGRTDGGRWGPINGTLHYRIYRAVNGVYLYVDEIDAAPGGLENLTFQYTDTKDADQLGEELPSLLWTPPPKTLAGIINLPNGMMAGFAMLESDPSKPGRELHFCEPYRPYAWPDTYSQVVDYPVVGLGRMDTTLAVLTKGNPYFIQGSAPDVAVMVKSDIEQACVAKRSIVSMGGAVFYASPDGLMMLSSSGSDILTKDLMDRDAWQALTPSSIIAYGHDSRYIAFHTPVTDKFGNVTSGFVLDLKSKQFVRHNLTAACGFNDLRTDQLYLAVGGSLVKWGEGSYLQGLWRSKLFSQPQMTGFACAQVEAAPLYDEDNVVVEAPAYPATIRLYADQRLFYTWTVGAGDYYGSEAAKLLAQRNPFRLPPLTGFLGRDWEIELDVKQEIFNVALAQSMSEIAGT